MAFTSITKPSVGDATKKTAFADAVINNLTDLNSRIGTGAASSGIPNSSFEDDGDADGDPDSWTVTNIGGTSGIIATSGNQAHGLNAWKVDYPDSSAQGATIQTNDYIAISPDEIIYLAWKMKGTSATGANHVVSLLWYTFGKTALAPTIIYSDTANPTAWTQCLSGAISPSTAKFMKIKIQGSDTTVPSATGSISFDDVRLVNGPADVFDNSNTYGPGTGLGTQPAWTAPSQIGCCWVEAIGGGGGSNSANQGGGGGGAYSAGYFIYGSGSQYTADPGAPGASEPSTGTAGGDATFNTTTVVAKGGSATGGTNTPGAGGLASGGTGVIKISGGTTGGTNYSGGSAARGGGGGGYGPTNANTPGGWPGGGGGGDLYSGGTSAPAGGMVKVWF
mgnify:CR=1 FL=1